MERKVLSVAWAEEKGYLYVETSCDGVIKTVRRKSTDRKGGRFAGRATFQVWDNVYSVDKSEVLAQYMTAAAPIAQARYEGRYVDLFKSGKGKGTESIKAAREVQERTTAKAEKPIAVVETPEPETARHEEYETIKQCIQANVPVYLSGPAGSGKNYVLEDIAWELDMEFFSTNSVQQEYKLTGFIDAGGHYHETEFYKACTSKRPCVFFLDEMDASIPEVLVMLNGAIANGYFEFPCGKVEFENVRFVAAGNTVGSGADELYNGRMVLDQASLDRFVIIEFDYSKAVEKHLANGNMQLVNFIRALRKQADEKGIRATFSYRCIITITKLETKMPLEKLLKIAVLKGMDSDTMRTLTPGGEGKYHTALRKLQGWENNVA